MLRDRTNPRRLRQEIGDLVDYILDLLGATPGQAEYGRGMPRLEVYTISEEAVFSDSMIICKERTGFGNMIIRLDAFASRSLRADGQVEFA